MTHLVSIILPVFNGELFIREAVDSVIAQTHTNWELLIVNDGSTDRTRDIVEEFADLRIKYFEQPNKGVSAARNKGLMEMRGDFFCFLDADDTMPKESISGRLPIFQDTRINFVDGIVISFNQEMTKQVSFFCPTLSGPPLAELLKLSSSCFFGITWLIRKNAELDYSFDQTMNFAEDLWFYTLVASHGGNYSFSEAPIYNRRIVRGSAMSNVKGLALGYKMFYEKVKDSGIASREEIKVLKGKIQRLYLKWMLTQRSLSFLRLIFKL